LNLADNYLSLGEMGKSKQAIDNIMSFYPDTAGVYLDNYYYFAQSIYAEYSSGEKQYNKAIELIDKVIAHFKETSDNQNYNESMKRKAKILGAMGDYKRAFEFNSGIISYADSIGKTQMSKQIQQLQTVYEVDKLKAKADQDAITIEYNRNIIFSLFVICVLLTVIMVTFRINSIKIKKKNEKIFEQYRDMDKYRRKISRLELFDENEPEKLSKEPSLFDKIEAYMRETESYREPDLSREFLATELKTNRQYLTQAIHENSNMTFNEYVNHYRLEYSRDLLSNNNNLSVEDIYTSAGFNNKSTFYRLFKQKYNLTPKELRDIAAEHE